MDRLTALPDRDLVLSTDLMELAYSDETAIFLVSYTPRAGAPVDPTKGQFDVAVDILDLSGKVISDAPQRTIHNVYYRPVGLDTTDAPQDQILAFVVELCTKAQGWADLLTSPTPLHELLAPPAAPSATPSAS